MPTTATRPATAPAPAAPLSFDERLALAVAAIDIRTETAPFDLADVIRVPVAEPQTDVAPRRTPVAAILHGALQHILRDGWCAGSMRDQDGRRCLYGAIRAQGGSRSDEAAAMDLLMDAIRREYPHADSVPGFNDAQSDWRVPVRILGEAAATADQKGI